MKENGNAKPYFVRFGARKRQVLSLCFRKGIVWKHALSLITLIIPISVRDSVDFIHKYVGHLGLYLRFLMISKIIKSHWKSAMHCYFLFPLQPYYQVQGNRALHSYLTKQKINVDHISMSRHISHDDYLFILNGNVSVSDLFQVCMSRKTSPHDVRRNLPDVRTLPRRPKYFFLACTIVSQGVFNSTLML